MSIERLWKIQNLKMPGKKGGNQKKSKIIRVYITLIDFLARPSLHQWPVCFSHHSWHVKTIPLQCCGVADLLQLGICSFRAIVGVDQTFHTRKNNLQASKVSPSMPLETCWGTHISSQAQAQILVWTSLDRKAWKENSCVDQS